MSNLKEQLTDAGVAVATAASASFGMQTIINALVPEIIHATFAVGIAVVASVCVFFVQRYLRHKFPDNHGLKG